MNLISTVKTIAKPVTMFVTKNSRQILAVAASGGVVATAVMASRASVKASKVIEEKKPEGVVETVKAVGKFYIAPITMGVATIMCIVGGTTISLKREAALTSLCSLAEASATELEKRVQNEIGEEKVKEIKQDIARDQIDRNPPTNENVIITGKGDELCLEAYTGRYFRSSVNAIDNAVNEFNRQLLGEMSKPLNDLYDVMNLPNNNVGDEVGWTCDELASVSYSSELTKDNHPCIVVYYDNAPTSSYRAY